MRHRPDWSLKVYPDLPAVVGTLTGKAGEGVAARSDSGFGAGVEIRYKVIFPRGVNPAAE